MSADQVRSGPIKPHPWTVESSRIAYSDRFITHRMDRCVTERGHVLDPYHILEFPGWCHVVALTDAGDLVLVEEYRHGCGEVVLGLPAGKVEGDEEPEAAMRRELTEETAHVADTWIPLPVMWANTATQANRVFGFLALGTRPGGSLAFDPGETIEVVVKPAAEAVAALMTGTWLAHGLQAAAVLAAREYAMARVATDPRLAPLAAPLTW